jgi:hypothetical protein
MNKDNFEYLKNSLKYLGFGDKLNGDLEQQLNDQPDKFRLLTVGEYARDNVKGEVRYVLDFKKSDTTDMYFLNGYRATLKHEDPNQEKTHVFYVNKGSGVTAKEAFNLLEGRSVHNELLNKEGQKYNAWLQLDFSEKDKNDNFKVNMYHQNYGFDLAGTLSKYPIKELTENDNQVLLKSLAKGNLHQVTFAREGGKEEKMYIEANPQYKSLNVYNSDLQRMTQSSDKREKQDPEKSKDKKESIQKDDDEDSPKKGNKNANETASGFR